MSKTDITYIVWSWYYIYYCWTIKCHKYPSFFPIYIFNICI